MSTSIMQTIAMSAAVLADAATIGMFGVILNNPLPQAAQVETEVVIASAAFERDFGGARSFEEVSGERVTMSDKNGTCIAWTITGDVLTREFGSCDDDRFASEPSVLVSNVSGSFTFQNIAGRPIISGIPTGDCDPFYTPNECDSTIPRIVSIDAEVRTGVRTTGFRASATTEAVSLDLVLEGTEDIEFLTTEIVHPSLNEGATP